jgi:hypothetical protein
MLTSDISSFVELKFNMLVQSATEVYCFSGTVTRMALDFGGSGVVDKLESLGS